jgi:hypothetical protein
LGVNILGIEQVLDVNGNLCVQLLHVHPEVDLQVCSEIIGKPLLIGLVIDVYRSELRL